MKYTGSCSVLLKLSGILCLFCITVTGKPVPYLFAQVLEYKVFDIF